ncbi:hypothetical protein ES707_02985 [subsurface metagenome]
MNGEKALNEIASALKRIAENYPEIESTRVFACDTDVIAASTSLTVTFLLNWRHFRIKVSELYADARTDFTYQWKFAGNTYDFNEITFDFGMKAVEDSYHEITLVIANTGTVDQEVGYYVRGWAVYKE